MSNILLIDHDEAQATTLAQALQNAGLKVTRVEDGSDGLALARTTRPDCIILAVELVNFSGYSVCNKVKRDKDLSAIPLLLASAQANAETFAEHSRLRTHAEAYAHKPYDVGAICEAVAELLAEGAAQAKPAPAFASAPLSSAAPAPQSAQQHSAVDEAPAAKSQAAVVKPARFGEEPSALDFAGSPFLTDDAGEADAAEHSAEAQKASGAPAPDVSGAGDAPMAPGGHDAAPEAVARRGSGAYSTDAQLLMESAVDTQLSTQIYDNFVLGRPREGSVSPAELIVEALSDIDHAAAQASAAEQALRRSTGPHGPLELPIEATPADHPATETGADVAEGPQGLQAKSEQSSSAGEGASTFETNLIDALRARIAELESSLGPRTPDAGATEDASRLQASQDSAGQMAHLVSELEVRATAAERARDEALSQLEAQKQTLAQIRSLLQHARTDA